MRTLFYLSKARWNGSALSFPAHVSPLPMTGTSSAAFFYVIKHGLQWKDAPAEYGPYKTLYNRFVRLSRLGVFSRIFTELANQTPFDGSLMIDSTARSPPHGGKPGRKKGGSARLIGRTKGGLNSKLHAVCDGHGRPVLLFC